MEDVWGQEWDREFIPGWEGWLSGLFPTVSDVQQTTRGDILFAPVRRLQLWSRCYRL